MIDYYLYFLYNWTMKYKGVVISEITIFATPTIYAELVGLLIIDLLIWLKELVIKRGIYLVAAILVWILVSSVEALQVREPLFRWLKISASSLRTGWSLALLLPSDWALVYIHSSFISDLISLKSPLLRLVVGFYLKFCLPDGRSTTSLSVKVQFRLYRYVSSRNWNVWHFACSPDRKLPMGLRNSYWRTSTLFCGEKGTK